MPHMLQPLFRSARNYQISSHISSFGPRSITWSAHFYHIHIMLDNDNGMSAAD